LPSTKKQKPEGERKKCSKTGIYKDQGRKMLLEADLQKGLPNCDGKKNSNNTA